MFASEILLKINLGAYKIKKKIDLDLLLCSNIDYLFTYLL
jgi:hypothetical protein